jgi:hypothetical protein
MMIVIILRAYHKNGWEETAAYAPPAFLGAARTGRQYTKGHKGHEEEKKAKRRV